MSQSSVIHFIHFLKTSHCAPFERGIGIRNSGNKVERGLKLELCMLKPRRGSRLASGASMKVGQWATGSVNAFLSLSLFLDLSAACMKSVFIYFLMKDAYRDLYFQINFVSQFSQ